MPKDINQKAKLFYIHEFLCEKTNEDHPATAGEIIKYLELHNIFAERKSVYSDIEVLRTIGDDIIQLKGKNGGYYIGQRDFTLPELKLLVDSVQASNFVTEKKSLELITKITKLTNDFDARQLNRQLYLINRAKASNEKSYYNVDSIHRAISEDKVIKFLYFSYNQKKEKEYHHEKQQYTLSPFALIWDKENYYLLGYNHENNEMRHYRVDRMESVQVTDETRIGKEVFKNYDMTTYTQSVFSMFNAEMRTVSLRVSNDLAGVIIDRFGKNIIMVPDGDNHFSVNVKIAVSSQFYSWIFGFGNKMEIIEPEDVRREMLKTLKETEKIYK